MGTDLSRQKFLIEGMFQLILIVSTVIPLDLNLLSDIFFETDFSGQFFLRFETLT